PAGHPFALGNDGGQNVVICMRAFASLAYHSSKQNRRSVAGTGSHSCYITLVNPARRLTTNNRRYGRQPGSQRGRLCCARTVILALRPRSADALRRTEGGGHALSRCALHVTVAAPALAIQ